jgi:outer membrane protein assembly factor BamB
MNRDDIALQVRDSLEKVHPHSLDHGVIVARAGKRRQRRRIGAIGAAFALVAVAAVVIAVVGGSSQTPLSPPMVQASARVALKGHVVGTAAAEGDYLWVLTCSTKCAGPPSVTRNSQGALVKIDNRTGEIVASTKVRDPGVVAVGEGGVWTASFNGVVTRFDPRTARSVGSVLLSLPKPVGTNYPEAFEFLPNNIVVGEGAVWVSTAREYVAQIDPETTEVVRMIPVRFGVTGLAVGGGSVWLSAGLFGLARIDPKTGEQGPTRPIEAPDGRRLSMDYLAVADGSLWARGGWAVPHGRTHDYVVSPKGRALGLARVDLRTGEVEQVVSFDGYIWVHAVSGGRLWLSGNDSRAGSRDVYVLNRGANKVTLAARLAKPGAIVGAVGTSLWVARPGQVLVRYRIPIREGR